LDLRYFICIIAEAGSMSVSPIRPVAPSTGAPAISVNPSEAEQIERVVNRLLQMGADPAQIGVVKAPLRICPLGAHIDHQLGIVTGMTIDQSVILAFAPSEEGTVRVESLNFPGEASFRMGDIPQAAKGDWANYIRGAVTSLRQQRQITQGLLGVVGGVMPIGGLSSSAAVTTAYLIALESLNSMALTESENVELCRLTENAYIGLNNGILDQSVILFGRKGHLTRIDCQSVEVDRLPAPARDDEGFAILVVYSGVTHSLTGTDYNGRVAECQEAARLLLNADGQTPPEDARLRHVRPELFEDYGSILPAPIYRRARHYFGEMDRVLAGQDAWMQGDLAAFGQLVNESGESSVRWYECGSPQLITLYETLREAPGVYGARFSGAGFRGSCIALVEPSAVEDIAATVHEIYPNRHPEEAERYSIHVCAQDGHARLLERTELEGHL
jgi:galactokinase